MPNTRILVLTGPTDPTIVDALSQPGNVVTRTATVAETLQLAADADVVVLDIVAGAEVAAAACRSLRKDSSAASAPVLCVAQTDSVEERILFLESGADDVITRPFDSRELVARVEALVLRLQRSNAVASSVAEGSERSSAPQLIAVFSPKGGAGTTTVAVNIAVLLARQVPDAVAIIDLDLQFGQVATHLNVPVRHSIVAVAHDAAGQSDREWFRSAAERHESGLHVFGAPAAPDEADDLTAAEVESLLRAAVAAYGTVVVDAGSRLDARIRALFALADAVVIVVTPEFPAVKAVNAFLEHLATSGADIGATTFVLNQPFARELLKLKDIEDAMGGKIGLQVPYDPFLFLKAVNEGVPVSLAAPRSPVTARFERLASMVIGSPVSATGEDRRRGPLGGLFGRG